MTSDRGSELIELGALVRSHGLHGDLVLKPFNPDSDVLTEAAAIVLKSRAGVLASHVIESIRPHGEFMLLTLQGVRTREQADALRGSLLCVPRSALPPLAEGEYYLADLAGLAVRDAQGVPLGTVRQVIEYPTVQCLVVVGPDGGLREVPLLDRYLLEVDISGGYVVVDHWDEFEPVFPKGTR